MLRICDDLTSNAGLDVMPFEYYDPISVLKSLYAELPDAILWGTDMPWHRFFHENKELSTYSEEVDILTQSDLLFSISDNVCCFLFGEKIESITETEILTM